MRPEYEPPRFEHSAFPFSSRLSLRPSITLSLIKLTLRLFPLGSDRLLLTALPGPRIGPRPLPSNRKSAAMAKTSVTTDIHQTLDAHRDFAAEISFHPQAALDRLTKPDHLIFFQILHAGVRIDVCLFQKFLRGSPADPIDVGETDLDSFLSRQINACNSSHEISSLITQPCRCLWRGFSQMTRITPFLLIILHLAQIALTDDRTFMIKLLIC